MKNHDLTVVLATFLLKTLQIFKLMDTTKAYILLNGSIKETLSVLKSILLTGQTFYETSFHDPTVKHVCIYFKIL